MPSRSRDVRVRLTSEADNKGFKSAEDSAKVLERELNKLEQSERRMASLHMTASREMAAAEAAKATAIVDANRRQADAMDSFGRKMLTASAAAAVGLGLTAKAAMDWESAWAGVTKTVDGSPEQMDALEDSLRGLAKTLPATHEEIAGVAEAAGQLGVARQDIAGFTRTMINMGETTNLSADEAATSIAQFSNIMGTGAGQADRLGAAIVALGNDGASTEADIMSMGLRIAGAGRTAGLTAPQVLAVASALSSVGIEAEAGGSAISRVMTQIESDVSSGKSTVQDYARVAGMSASEFADKWQNDAAGALTSFIQGLGSMQAQGQDTTAVLDQLGFSDLRVADTLRRASLAGDLLADSIKTGSKAFEENIALTDEANKRYQTTEARLQIARNQINDAAIDIGGNLLPAVAAGSEKVGALATAFGSLSPQTQSFVTGLGAAAVGVGTLVGGAAIAIPKLKELSDTLLAMSGGSSRTGKALGGLASLLAGPWGLALAGATVAVGAWATAQGEAQQKVLALADGVDVLTGSLNAAGEAVATSELTKSQSFGLFGIGGTSSMIKEADALGVSLETITAAYTDTTEAGQDAAEAALAAADAYERANPFSAFAEARANAFREAVVDQRDRLKEATEVAQGRADVNGELAGSTETVTAATEQHAAMMEADAAATEQSAAALDEWLKATKDADASFIDLAGGYSAVVAKNQEIAQSTADATESTKDSWEDFYDGVSVSVADYLAELESQAAAQAAWEENMVKLAGRASQGVIDELMRMGPEGAPLVAELVDASDEELGRLESVFGENADAATGEFADRIRAAQMPDIVVDADTTRAQAKLMGLRVIYDALQNKTVVVAIDARAATSAAARLGVPVAVEANGSVLSFANGGENHVAQIAPAGAWRVWAEDETGGEAYIPLAQSKRARSEAILENVASRFGMYVGRYADGAVLGAIGAGGNMPLTAADLAVAMSGMRLTLDVEGRPISAIARAETVGFVGAKVDDAAGRRQGGGWH